MGAAWQGRQQGEAATAAATAVGPSVGDAAQPQEGTSFDAELLKLAVAQRMNTDVRRTIFCTVMSSEDFMDATDKLLRLKLKGKQEREVVRVLMDCAVQEKPYNPFYAHTLVKLCECQHSHRITLQVRRRRALTSNRDRGLGLILSGRRTPRGTASSSSAK